MARDSLLLIGLVVVGLVAVRLLLPDGPLTGTASQEPGNTETVIGSVAPGTASAPSRSPGLLTLPPMPTPSDGLATAEPSPVVVPTSAPGPTPTLRPGQTPAPTPKPTTPGATAAGTATVTVVVQIVKDDGGTAVAANWTITADSAGSASPGSFAGSATGTTVTLSAGQAYEITDSGGPSGYASQRSTRCSSAGSSLPAAGGSYLCTILKNDIKPRITVYTNVVGGGPQTAADWTVTVTGTDVTPASTFNGSGAGVQVLVHANATYSIDQTNPSGGDYDESVGSNCSGSLGPGAAVSCTFTYTYNPPTEPPPSDPPPASPALFLLVAAGPPVLGRRRWNTIPSR